MGRLFREESWEADCIRRGLLGRERKEGEGLKICRALKGCQVYENLI